MDGLLAKAIPLLRAGAEYSVRAGLIGLLSVVGALVYVCAWVMDRIMDRAHVKGTAILDTAHVQGSVRLPDHPCQHQAADR